MCNFLIMTINNFLNVINCNFLVETDDNRLIFLDSDLKKVNEINYYNILTDYKARHNLTNGYEGNEISESLSEDPKKLNSYKYSDKMDADSDKHQKEEKYKENQREENNQLEVYNQKETLSVDSFIFDKKGNVLTSDKNFNCNISDLLQSSYQFKNIQISSRFFVFDHTEFIPAISTEKSIILPIIALEVFLKDILTGEFKEILKMGLNTKSILHSKIDEEVLKWLFKASEENLILKEQVKSICTFKEKEGVLRPIIGHFDETKLITFYPQKNTKKSLFQKLILLSTLVSLASPFIFLLRKIFKKKYSYQIFIKKQKNYELLNGIYEKREILIKRYNRSDIRFQNEIKILSKNIPCAILKYHLKINSIFHVDLIFSRPTISLKKYCEKNYKCRHVYSNIKKIYFNDTELFHRIAQALAEVHKAGIILNNLSPNNIFISGQSIFFSHLEDACYFEKGKCIIKPTLSQTDIKKNYRNIGSMGYQSQEIINGNINFDNFEECKASDRFSLCIIFYEMVYKCHPFLNYFNTEKGTRNWDEICENISKGANFLKWRLNIPLFDLVSNSFSENPSLRYSDERFLKHFFFWSPSTCFEFVANLSDVLECFNPDTKRVISILTNNQHKVFNIQWDKDLHTSIVFYLEKSRNYRFDNLKSLTRAIRNGGRHYNENSAFLNYIYNDFPNGYMNYYMKKFPYLISTLYYSAISLKKHELLKAFYPTSKFFNSNTFFQKSKKVTKEVISKLKKVSYLKK